MYEWFWLLIPKSYAIKQFLHLTDMQLTGVICIFKHKLNQKQVHLSVDSTKILYYNYFGWQVSCSYN